MVYINDKKYACESCIKGHRSSACRHNDRPLFEIKKKGRPVSQCDKCRHLRQTRKVHGKCMCNVDDAVAEAAETASRAKGSTSKPKEPKVRGKRFIPSTPTLPNGLKDVAPPESLGPSDPRQQVNSLLNPCHCKDVWSCQCRSSHSTTSAASSPTPSPAFNRGLAALAQAAAICCSDEATSSCCAPMVTSKPTKKRTQDGRRTPTRAPSPVQQLKRTKTASCCSKPSPSVPESPTHHSSAPVHEPGPALPPLDPLPSHVHVPAPSFPPLTALASLAGTGCACGFECACPGCRTHRGTHASHEHKDCPHECGTCVDNESGIGMELPFNPASATRAGDSFLDKFFAQAAALPLPPASRLGALDPTNIMVYPPDLFASAEDADARRVAFGLGTRLPKLECCGGRCGCPGETCACGEVCDGCCAEHEASGPKDLDDVSHDMIAETANAKKSCCSV